MKNLNQLRDRIFEINKANGWHEEKRSFGELIALVHSEVSEALEDYRNGRLVNEIWYEHVDVDSGNKFEYHEFTLGTLEGDKLGKPCGIPSELADIVIRILDICGLCEWDIEKIYKKLKYGEISKSFVVNLAMIHLYLSDAFAAIGLEGNENDGIRALAETIFLIEEMCRRESIDLESIIHQKLEYNKTRGYRHGGKVI